MLSGTRYCCSYPWNELVLVGMFCSCGWSRTHFESKSNNRGTVQTGVLLRPSSWHFLLLFLMFFVGFLVVVWHQMVASGNNNTTTPRYYHAKYRAFHGSSLIGGPRIGRGGFHKLAGRVGPDEVFETSPVG